DEAGRSASVRTTGATVEHDGRLRASIRVTGHVPVDGRQLDVVARVDVFAGRRLLRVRTTICNPQPARHPGNYWDLGDPGSVLIKDASLVLDLASPIGRLAVVPEIDVPPRIVGVPFELYQDSSGGDYWDSTNHMN